MIKVKVSCSNLGPGSDWVSPSTSGLTKITPLLKMYHKLLTLLLAVKGNANLLLVIPLTVTDEKNVI